MSENKTCKGCKWNEFPICKGIIQENGNFKRIDNLRPIFGCGVKDMLIPLDNSIRIKSDSEKKIIDLESRIKVLEDGKTP